MKKVVIVSESEKRLHRCCFTGHRPEKLSVPESRVKYWLSCAIDQAIEDGYTTFITGMARGVDLWAGEIVLQRKQAKGKVTLVCAAPYPGFEKSWEPRWRERYALVASSADYRLAISTRYHPSCFQKRNQWMVNHAARVIAVYNGQPGGTRNTILYAESQGFSVSDMTKEYPGKTMFAGKEHLVELQANSE